MSYTHCTVTVLFNEKEYQSTVLDLNDLETANLIYHILENGTSQIDSYQLPILDDEVIIFSREQLDFCLFKIKFITQKPKPTRKRKINIVKE